MTRYILFTVCLQLIATAVATAQPKGQVISVTTDSPLLPGENLNVTVVVQNTSGVWIPIESNPSWYFEITNFYGWTPPANPPVESFAIVELGQMITNTTVFSSSVLPTNAGVYSFDVNAYSATGPPPAYIELLNSPYFVNFQVLPSLGSSNEAPTDILLSNTSIPEHSDPVTAIGALSTIDTNTGDLFTYTFASGPGDIDNNKFTISGSNLLSQVIFNYELQSNLSVRVQSEDLGGLSTQKIFGITVTDIAEPEPVIVGHSVNGSGHVILQWKSQSNHFYKVRYSHLLIETIEYSTLITNLPATPPTNTFIDTTSTPDIRYWHISSDL